MNRKFPRMYVENQPELFRTGVLHDLNVFDANESFSLIGAA
jgi:hypothetical protein